jgi:hypothetical protein
MMCKKEIWRSVLLLFSKTLVGKKKVLKGEFHFLRSLPLKEKHTV